MTPDAGQLRRSSHQALMIADGIPHSSYIEKSADCGDLKERVMLDIFSKIRQEQIEDKQKRVVASANTVAAKKSRDKRTINATGAKTSESNNEQQCRSASEQYRQ